MEIKKKIIPFILGLSVAAALPLAAHATDNPEQDSGNVEYGTFADVSASEAGETDLVTAIPECIMTIPRDTTIKKGALSANIGRVTIEGHYFVKPYYVEVSATKADFTRVYTSNDTIPSGKSAGDRMDNDVALAKQDILFDVATTRKPAGETADDAVSTATGTGHSAADETTFVKNGVITLDGNNKSSFTATRACRRFWKDETQDLESQDTNYVSGELSDIKGQENIWLRIGETQWTGDTSTEQAKADTKPEGGLYKGSITFNAEFKDDYVTGMSKWRNL